MRVPALPGRGLGQGRLPPWNRRDLSQEPHDSGWTDGICRNARTDAGLRLLAIIGVNEDGTQEALRRTWTAAIREGTDRGFDSTPERFGDKRPKVIWGSLEGSAKEFLATEIDIHGAGEFPERTQRLYLSMTAAR